MSENSGYNETIPALVREETAAPLRQYFDYVLGQGPQLADEFSVDVSREECERILLRLREKLRPLGYLAFRTEKINTTEKHSVYISIQRMTDDLDIVRYLRISAANYDLGTEDIVAKLKDWRTRFSYEIVGAGLSSVEILFHTLPDDMDAFARELYDFCPDLLDQGYSVVIEHSFDNLSPEQQERVQRVLDEEPESEHKTERAALLLLADDIQQTRRLTLWWD